MKQIAVVTTVGNHDEATRMATTLVERGIAACAHISEIASVYTWKGAVRSEREFRVLFKTTREEYDAIERAIRELHSYELPAIYAVALERVWAPYAAWIDDNSRGESRGARPEATRAVRGVAGDQEPRRVTFPVLCLSRDSSMAVAETSERLHRCNARAFFTNRYYDELLVIDSTAARFRVVRAEVVPPLSAIGRRTARAFNRRLHVELQLEAQGVASLDEAKRVVVDWLHRAPDFWEASRGLAEWKHLVAQAGSAKALIALFT